MDPKNLASRLCYLPIYVVDRVYLWLTYKGLKTASLITINSKAFPNSPERIARIIHWVEDAGFHHKLDPRDPEEGRTLLVSKDQFAVKKLAAMKIPLTDQDHYDMGILFGYPPKAVKTVAFGKLSELSPHSLSINSVVKHQPEALYANYVIRLSHEKEDVKVAKKWMDTIRKDIPKLAKWYEKEAATAIEK